MSAVSALWRLLRSEEMKKIFNLASQEMNGYALFIKRNIPAFSIDGTLIDPARLNVSDGTLMPLQNLSAGRESFFSSTIKAEWDKRKDITRSRLNDVIWAISYVYNLFFICHIELANNHSLCE